MKNVYAYYFVHTISVVIFLTLCKELLFELMYNALLYVKLYILVYIYILCVCEYNKYT